MSVTAPVRPIDLAHLAQYTGGDPALNGEVLTLFASQAEQNVARLRILLDKADTKAWRELIHTLKGAARGVGAFALADAAAAAESLDLAVQTAEAARAVEALRAHAHGTKLFIEAYLKA